MFTLPLLPRTPLLWGGCGGGGVYLVVYHNPPPCCLGGLGGVGLVVVYRIVVAILSSGNPSCLKGFV